MAGPWEAYQFAAPADGPWSAYQAKGKEKGGPSEAYQKGRQESDPLARAIANTMQGPLFGFGDELMGAVSGTINTIRQMDPRKLPENYRNARDFVRGIQDQYKEDFPIGSVATQVAASAPTLVAAPSRLIGNAPVVGPAATRIMGAGSQAVPAGLVGNTIRAATTGAGYGAVGGLGNSTSEDINGMLMDSLYGAGTGLAAGAVLTPVQAAMGSAGRTVMSRLSDAAAMNYANEKVAQALARDARGNLFTSGQANPANQVAARLPKLGEDARLVDAAGRNTTQLLDTLATLPGRAKEQVAQAQRQRAATSGDRLRSAADQALGTQGQRLAPTLDDLVTQREAAAGPLYARLREISVAPTDELRGLVSAAEKLGAASKAKSIATAKQLPYTLTLKDDAGPALMNQPRAAQWSMRDLDLLKQGLDDIAANNMDAAGKMTPFGKSVMDLKRKLVQRLDEATFDPRTGDSLYASARSAFAGPSAMIDAANAGRQILTKDESAITSLMQGMGQSEREAFRIGAFEALRAKLGTQSGQTQIMNMWKEPSTREKLQAIFADERSFREFAAATSAEGVKKRIQSVGTGSQTASRQAGMGDLDLSALSDLGTAANAMQSGALLTALGSARNAWNRVATPEPVRNEMARLLLSQGPQAQQNVNRLAQLVQQLNERNAIRADASGLIGSQLGNRLLVPAP